MIGALQALVSILAWGGILLSTLFWSGLIFLAYPLHPWLDPRRSLLHRLASGWGRVWILLSPGARLEITGLAHIPRGRPVIFMGNHQSYVDVPALFCLPAQFRWVADEGLFRIPVFGWAMRLAGYVPVNRGDAISGLRALETAKGWLERGVSVFVFPEGTRSHTGMLGRFQTGGFRLAVEAGVPIVPVVIGGTRQLLPRGSWIFRWGSRLTIRVLPPIPPAGGRRPIRGLAHLVRGRMRQEYSALLRERKRVK